MQVAAVAGRWLNAKVNRIAGSQEHIARCRERRYDESQHATAESVIRGLALGVEAILAPDPLHLEIETWTYRATLRMGK